VIRVDSKDLSVYYAKDNDNLAFKSSAEFVSVSPPLRDSNSQGDEATSKFAKHNHWQLSRKNNQTLADFNEQDQYRSKIVGESM
jgi:hypothetical protein